ncbi:purine-binding chemotaxis protein CheW [Anaerobacillus sp. HL2]|nr:purine-binding chemotaxis protein CheW [Anaerobacillus sp. HL2]
MIPDSPSFVEGVINLRDIVIPVLNLKEIFHLPETEVQVNSKIIITSFDGKQIGFIVDEASNVMTLDENDIVAPIELLKGNQDKFIVGLAKIAEKNNYFF